LRVQNDSNHARWLLVSALDAEYFAPDEAAVLFKGRLGGEDEVRATRRFRELSIPLKTSPGQTNEGYVLAPRHEGGRYVAVTLAGTQHVLEFGFPVTLPDGEFDFEQLDPKRIYPEEARPRLTLRQLRAALRALPCCTSNKDGSGEGDPLNLVLVGSIDDVLASLSRGGWSFTHRIGPQSIKRMIGASLSGSA
jgi:hypothetical protein